MKKIEFEVPEMEEIIARLDKIDKKIESINKEKSLTGLLLTSKEASKALMVSPRSLQTYRDRGLIPFIQFGREVRFRPEDIQQFLKDHFVKSNYYGGKAV